MHGPSVGHPWGPVSAGTPGVKTGSHITKVYDTARTPCTQMPARKDVPEETKKRLLVTRAELDLMSLHYEIFLCQEQLDEIAKRRQPTRWIVEYYRRCCRS